jgi:polyisoprenoid-binding protein YceI
MKMTTMISAMAAMVLVPAMGALAQSSTWAIDPAHSQAGFEIRHMGVSNVRGTISKVAGAVVWDEKDAARDSVVADLDATTVDTTVGARDTHLKSPDFFDVAKYPTIHFQSTAVKREGGKLMVMGNLTLAGVTKPVMLDVDGPVPPQKGMHGGLVSGFSASTTIKRADFSFGPKFAPPMLGDEVKITIDVEIDQK